MRLLFVTPYFPPSSGSGVPRGAKFVKYLRRLGWEVRVVTVDPAAWPERDGDLAADVEGVPVRAVGLTRIPGVSHVLLRAAPGIRKAVREEVRSFRPDVVLATTPDWHWLAVDAVRAGVPLVLDYPDPWTVLPPDFRTWQGPTKVRSKIKWALAPRAEHRLVGRAAAAVFATQPIRDAYADRWHEVAGRTHVITNGFDEEDFAGRVPGPPGPRLRVAHVGSFAGSRRSQTVARAVAAAAADGSHDIELVLAGAGVDRDRPGLKSILGEVPLVAPGWIGHGDAVQTMLDADVLWLDAGVGLRSAATGKVFEYLRAGKPIVALAHPRSPAATLIGELDAGVVVSTEDPTECGDAILRAASAEFRPVPAELLEPFSRERLAGQLSEVLAAATTMPA